MTPDDVRRTLYELAGIEVSGEEAAALVPRIAALRASLARLDRFDLADTLPASTFDPTFAYEAEEGGPHADAGSAGAG